MKQITKVPYKKAWKQKRYRKSKAEEMEVEIKERRVVVPCRAPFEEEHVLPLSHLDNDPNLRVSFRYLRAYSSPAADPFAAIAAALSEALVPYYPLAGSLRPRPDNRLELLCSDPANSGVPLLRAASSSTLASALSGHDHLLAPADDPGTVCALQFTSFACGGYVLGAAIHHSLCDGLGASLFFNYMAALARKDSEAIAAAPSPVWGRDRLLPATGLPPPPDSPVRHFLTVGSAGQPYSQPIGEVIRVRFRVTDAVVDAFKRDLLHKSGSTFTTFEALGAFIWRAKVRASKIEGEKKVKYAYAVNIRRVVRPALPQGYWGNGCVPMYVVRSAGEVAESAVWDTAWAIKGSKRNVADHYVRSFVDLQAAHHGEGITAGDDVSAFTDWRHLGHNTVDFGWGGPVDVVPISTRLLGGQEPCYFLPDSAAVGSDPGFCVSVALRQTAMPAFKAEMDAFCAGHFGL